jgi:hypothetical protein
MDLVVECLHSLYKAVDSSLEKENLHMHKTTTQRKNKMMYNFVM